MKETMEIFPPKTAAGSGRESRRKPEWKRKRNEDGSEWNRDMRFRLRLGAMNIPMGEAARPAKKTGSVWLEYSVRGHKQKQVRSLGMSSRCALVHLRAQTQPVHSLRPPHPSPHPRLCCTTWARIRLLNKLFRKSQLSSANSAHNNNMKLSIVLASNHV